MDDIAPLLAKRCVRCHGGFDGDGKRKIEGNYDLSRYSSVLRTGSDDVPNVLAGDPSSALLSQLDPAKPANAPHWGYLLPSASDLAPGETAEGRRDSDWAKLKAWVVDAGLRYARHVVHPAGWVHSTDRTDPAFHGGYLRARRWDTTECKTCHGDDLRGEPDGAAAGTAVLLSGSKAGSCATCHSAGVNACTTCHGDDLRSGLAASAPPRSLSGSPASDPHAAHLGGGTIPFASPRCEDCHKVPERVDDVGHLGDSFGRVDFVAEVILSARATAGVPAASAGYKVDSKTCQVACHGGALKTPGQKSTPAWTQKTKIACGDCHAVADIGRAQGAPAHFGGSADCARCHKQGLARCTPSASDATCFKTGDGVGVKFTDAARHGDGKTPLGSAGSEGKCYGCHGTAASGGAPAPDLAGSTDRTSVTVGAHAKHLAAGVPCTACHKVPTAVDSPGHIDSDRPAEVVFDLRASGGTYNPPQALAPKWDRATATCSNVYCHSLPDATQSMWSWTDTTIKVGCTSCHGAPPKTTLGGQPHPNNPVCQFCHASAYRPDGTLDPALHNNGRVNR